VRRLTRDDGIVEETASLNVLRLRSRSYGWRCPVSRPQVASAWGCSGSEAA